MPLSFAFAFNIPKGTVRVHVGLKPNPFFDASLALTKKLQEQGLFGSDQEEIARIQKIKDRRERMEKAIEQQWQEGLRRFNTPKR